MTTATSKKTPIPDFVKAAPQSELAKRLGWRNQGDTTTTPSVLLTHISPRGAPDVLACGG